MRPIALDAQNLGQRVAVFRGQVTTVSAVHRVSASLIRVLASVESDRAVPVISVSRGADPSGWLVGWPWPKFRARSRHLARAFRIFPNLTASLDDGWQKKYQVSAAENGSAKASHGRGVITALPAA